MMSGDRLEQRTRSRASARIAAPMPSLPDSSSLGDRLELLPGKGLGRRKPGRERDDVAILRRARRPSCESPIRSCAPAAREKKRVVVHSCRSGQPLVGNGRDRLPARGSVGTASGRRRARSAPGTETRSRARATPQSAAASPRARRPARSRSGSRPAVARIDATVASRTRTRTTPKMPATSRRLERRNREHAPNAARTPTSSTAITICVRR